MAIHTKSLVLHMTYSLSECRVNGSHHGLYVDSYGIQTWSHMLLQMEDQWCIDFHGVIYTSGRTIQTDFVV